MNELIQEIAKQGLQDSMYDWIGIAAAGIALLYSLWHGKRLGVSIWKMVIILATVFWGMFFIQSGIWEVVQYVQEIHFLGIETAVNSIVRVMVFLPLPALIPALILRVKWSLACDAIVMYPLIRSCLAQLACLFPGCCRGYEWEFGIYNIKTGSYHFPTQILETVLTLLIFAYLVMHIKGKQYVSDGSLYPRMMILYGIMRFICELLRDNEKILLGIPAVAFHAAFMVIVGAVWMLILSRKKEKLYGNSIQTNQTPEDEVCEGPQSP